MRAWTLIKGGTVVDGTSQDAHPETSVLLCDDRIVTLGGPEIADNIPRGESLTTIDASGKTIMPGLIDAHCHISFGESRTQEEQDLYTSTELRTLRSAWSAQKLLRAGVTSISNPGGSYYIGVGIREGAKEGLVRGPRIKTAGRFIVTSNSLGDHYPDSVGVPSSSISAVTNTVPEMISEVRHQIKNGVDFIKLADSPLGDYQAFTNDEVRILTDLAHQHNKQITTHARGSAEVDAAVAAGMDWIMHGNTMTDEVISRLANSQIPLVPTLLLLANNADWGHLVGVPEKRRDGFKRLLDASADTYHRAREAGVKFVTGTDAGFSLTPYGEWHARELELLVDYAGLSPMEAITAATSHAAETLGMANEVGIIKPDMKADILVVNGDPLRDIRTLQDKKRIETVILDGEVMDIPESVDHERHPYNRALIQATGDLTYELVYDGAPSESGSGDYLPWRGEEAHTLATDLETRQRRAQTQQTE